MGLSRQLLFILLLVTLIAGALRFWHLGEPGRITSDEYYFVNDARHYLSRTFFFDAHPPFGKLLIAGSMAVVGDRPVGWRWLVALLGTLLVPLSFLLGRQLASSSRVGLALASFVAIDGAFVVNSRLALLDTTLVFFGLLAVWLAARSRSVRSWSLVGLIFGLAVGTKWLALFFLPLLVVFLWRRSQQRTLAAVAFCAAIAMVYLITFAMHFMLIRGKADLLTTHRLMWHQHVTTTAPHAYQSAWWSWPLQLRPFVYTNDPGPDSTRRLIVDLGNPLLWWGGLLGALAAMVVRRRDQRVRLLTFGFLATWLPFVLIRRPMFSYNVLLVGPFLWLLALTGWDAWAKTRRRVIASAVVAVILVSVSVWFWPLWSWRPVTPSQLNARQWIPSWTVPQSERPH